MTPEQIRREKVLALAVVDAAIEHDRIRQSLPGPADERDDLWLAVRELASGEPLDESVAPEHEPAIRAAAAKYQAVLDALQKLGGAEILDRLDEIDGVEDLPGYRRAVDDLHEHALSVRRAIDGLRKKWGSDWDDSDIESSVWEQVEEVSPAKLKKLRALEDEKWDLVLRLKQERAIVRREQRKFWGPYELESRFSELTRGDDG